MPDALDVLTADEAKSAVKLSASRASEAEDFALPNAVTAISRLLDDLCGPIVIRTVEAEEHDANSRIVLKHAPVVSITTITDPADPVTVGDDYRLRSGMLESQAQVLWSAAPSQTVFVTYVAGRFDSTETVDQKFKKAAAEILQGNWTKFAAAWARGGDALADPIFFDEVSNIVKRWLPYETLGSPVA